MNLKAILLTSFFILSNAVLFPQSHDESWKVFDDSQIGRVDISINPSAIDYLYKNVQSDSEFVAKLHFKNRFIDQTVDSIGFRLRGNTSRESQKKSFKVSFNSYQKGRKFFGLEKLNLNGEHNDPSIIRSKLCFDHFRSIGLNASRASHLEVYINGSYYGLYISVEHIDEEFLRRRFQDNNGNLWKCLYPADLTYLGDDPAVYKNLYNNGTPVYDLSTNQSEGDYSRLARLIRIINKTSGPVFHDSIESVIDITETLKYLSMNIILGSWDSYWTLRNNYYLYYEPSAEIFHIIPYDYDNTFGIEWGSANWSSVNPYNPPKVAGGTMPLAEKLMSDNQYRNLYTHFLEFYRDNLFRLDLWEARIDSLKDLITPSALNDTYRTKDWGFTTTDFLNSFTSASYSNKHVKFGLKQYINLRNSSLKNQLGYVTSKPIIYKVDYTKNPPAGDSIYIRVSAFSNIGIADASVNVIKNGSSKETSYPLKFSPAANTRKVEEADRFIAVIPPLLKGENAVFNIRIKDMQNNLEIYPEKGSISFTASANNIVINEFLADNLNANTDPSGDHDDWVELYNPTSSPVLLSGKYLTDNPFQLNKWRFSKDSLYLNSGERLLVWLDEQQSQPGLHANFKLSKSGEYIAIVDNDSTTIIDSISFGRQTTDLSFGRYPDGTGNWQLMVPTPEARNRNAVSGIRENITPGEFDIKAYPNPFNPQTRIQYQLKSPGHVTIKIFDALGKELKTLIDEEKSTGTYKLNLDARSFSSGFYFCRIQAGSFLKTIKLLLLR